MTQLWIATGNPGKLTEFKMLLNKAPLEIHGQAELPVYSPPPETGDSFLANARIKAKSLKSVVGAQWCMGEDSGLIVDGLGGLPGVHSARYAGTKASDRENVAKLLKMVALRTAQKRAARFSSTIVAYTPTGEEMIFEGILSGQISTVSRGDSGFGYDSIFIPDGESKTIAELGLAYKNRVSHRARAVQAMVEMCQGRWG